MSKEERNMSMRLGSFTAPHAALSRQGMGKPVHDDRRLFEMLLLEGAQAGLSWETVLRRREGYRRAFAGFDPAKVATFGRDKQAALLRDVGIIRNRLKIEAAVSNARAFLAVQNEFGSFDRYVLAVRGRRPHCQWLEALVGRPGHESRER